MKQVLGNPEKNQRTIIDKNFNSLLIVSAFMITSYITANVMAVKLVQVYNVTIFDAGTITFPISFMLGNVLTEIWGFKTTKKVIILTFLCNLFFVISTSIGIILPSPDYMEVISSSYRNIFVAVPRILFASFVAFLCGELMNSWSMEKIKKITNEKYLWVRTILSSAIGYIFDTVPFTLIAFWGVAPLKDMISMLSLLYFAKIAIEIFFGTPFAYLLIWFLRKREGKNCDE